MLSRLRCATQQAALLGGGIPGLVQLLKSSELGAIKLEAVKVGGYPAKSACRRVYGATKKSTHNQLSSVACPAIGVMASVAQPYIVSVNAAPPPLSRLADVDGHVQPGWGAARPAAADGHPGGLITGVHPCMWKHWPCRRTLIAVMNGAACISVLLLIKCNMYVRVN